MHARDAPQVGENTGRIIKHLARGRPRGPYHRGASYLLRSARRETPGHSGPFHPAAICSAEVLYHRAAFSVRFHELANTLPLPPRNGRRKKRTECWCYRCPLGLYLLCMLMILVLLLFRGIFLRFKNIWESLLLCVMLN